MKFFAPLFVFLCLAPFVAHSATNVFARALYVGIRGDDVRALQKFLNTDAETRVAEGGAGSQGNETDYFGLATKRALIRFQEKYRAEVLTPVGLVSGTGFFGEKTRAKMNALMVPASASVPAPAPVSVMTLPKEVVAPLVEKGEVILMFPSQYSGKPGTMITLSGAGFTATDNTIYFGDDHAVVKAVSWNGQSITFKIPNIPKGIYKLFVKNARGDSNKGAWFVVTDGVTPEPKIDSVTPERVVRGETVTVKGSGFASVGNVVPYGAGVLRNISSADGVSLSFVVPADLWKEHISSSAKKMSVPMWVTVINENGVSNQKSFILEL